jgi:hypothetical protein
LSGGSLASGLNLTYGTNSYTGTAIVATGNATAAQVLYPYTASNASGSLTGSFTAAPATAYVGSYGTGTVGTLTGAYSGGTAYSVTPGSTSIAYISTSGTVTTFPTWQPYTGLTSTGTNQIAGITFATTSGTANNGTLTGSYSGGNAFTLAGSQVYSGLTVPSGTGTVLGSDVGASFNTSPGTANVGYNTTWTYLGNLQTGGLQPSTSGLMSSYTFLNVTGNNSFGNLSATGTNMLTEAYYVSNGGTVNGSANAGYVTTIGGTPYNANLSLAGSSSFITSGSGSLASGAALTWSGSQISYGSGTGYIGTRTIVPSAPVIPPTFQSQKFDVHKQPAKKD